MKPRPNFSFDTQNETNKQKNPIHDNEEGSSHLKSQGLQVQKNTDPGNNNLSKRTQSSDEIDKTKDNPTSKDNTENVERLIRNGSMNFEKRAKVSDKGSMRGEYKTNIKSNVAIRKPNFMKSNQSVGLIKQDVKLVPDGERYWQSFVLNEHVEYCARYMFLEGVHSIICLDISESMANSDAWTEARIFITDYLIGFEKMSKFNEKDIKTEYVAVVTFGHQTKMQVGYTDDLRNIEKELDQIKLGGPTQMYGGVLMAYAAAWCSEHQNRHHFKSYLVHCLQTKAKISQRMETFRKDHVDLFFVPVAYSDTEDLKSIQASEKRHHDDNRNVRNVYNETESKQLPTIGSLVRRGPDLHHRMQDSNGPGTVIGHADNNQQVWVEWDADEYQNIYMYGPLGYDVLIVDEPRKLKPGDKIATGCKVLPGKDWKITDCSVRFGVVVNVNRRKKKALVRWNNGKRDSYLYDDLQEIKVKADGDISGDNSSVKEKSSRHTYELEPPQAMTIEEYAAKQNPKKNKNFK